MTLVPLVVAVPVLAAAMLASFGHFLPARVPDLVAISVAVFSTVASTILIFRSSDATIHYWFGGWRPRNGIAIGISFSVDPLGAALTALVGVLATAALVVSWDYFRERVPPQFHVLMLLFLGALAGFALSSDLFNMFVFFELMSVAAYALTAYRIERPSVLQGAISFAIVNSIGAFMLLIGIALLYARTGTLNLAQMGQVLARHGADGLVIVAFTLVTVGFLTKAGAVPFHFWLSDAYAVAPAPVCVLFAGVMSDLALHAVARVYWQVFSGPLGTGVRPVLIGVGILTALVGAVMAWLQAGLKRMLAFVTISHIGLFLVGIALLTARGLAAATVYVIADGLVKGSLFCSVAHLARRTGHTDELVCHGRGRVIPWTGVLVAVGAVGLAAVPPLGTFVPFGLLGRSAGLAGYGWVPPVLVLATALTGGAVLRAAGRIFLGLGPREDDLLVSPPPGEEEDVGMAVVPRRGALLWVPALLLLVGGLGIAVTPGLPGRAVQHAEHFIDREAVAGETLHGGAAPLRPVPAVHASPGSYLYGIVAVLAAMAFATLGLYRSRTLRIASPAARRLKLLHDGVVGEYVTWLTVGAAALGVLFVTVTR